MTFGHLRMAKGAFRDEHACCGDEYSSRCGPARRTTCNAVCRSTLRIRCRRSHVGPCAVQVGPERPSHVWSALLSLGIMLITTRQTTMQPSQKAPFRSAMCRRLTAIMFVLLTTAGWGFGPSANLNADRVVEARQASMVLASVAMPVIADMATGRAAYDPERALVLAERIASLAATSAELFPPTSSSNARSRARASLWRDKPAFDADMQQYVRLAATLAGAARGRSLQALREPALNVAQACRSCHRDYADLD